MSDQIYLTPVEQQAAAFAVCEAIAKGKRHHGVVFAVIDAINALREDGDAK